jgi:hypothetical protein
VRHGAVAPGVSTAESTSYLTPSTRVHSGFDRPAT